MTRSPCSGQTVTETEGIGRKRHECRDLSARALKTAANAAAGEKKPEAYPPGTLRIFRAENKVGRRFQRPPFGRYSETGINCRIQFPKLPGLRL